MARAGAASVMRKRACACGERSIDGMQHARRHVIGDVAAGAAQQRVVLLAGNCLADAEFGHVTQPDAVGARLGARLQRAAIQLQTT